MTFLLVVLEGQKELASIAYENQYLDLYELVLCSIKMKILSV